MGKFQEPFEPGGMRFAKVHDLSPRIALAMTPHRAMAMMSIRRCWVRLRTRGSLRGAKYF